MTMTIAPKAKRAVLAAAMAEAEKTSAAVKNESGDSGTKKIGPDQLAEETARQIISGRRLKRGEDCSFLLTASLEILCASAGEIRNALCPSQVELCSIINGRSGRCGEDCKFCAQSACHGAKVEEYPFLEAEEIVEDMRRHKAQNVRRYSIVTAGRALCGAEFYRALNAYRMMVSESGGMEFCASLGLLSEEDFGRLREAGISRYHANIETSRRYFPSICTTHSYEDKLEVIRRAKAAGLTVCSGGIIGMGESWEDRVDMALSLYELGIRSIPLNVLKPIKGTPFEKLPLLEEADILRTIAIFRYFNPEAQIRLAAGRDRMEHSGRKAFQAGANAAITGDMLTTSGNRINEDQEMLVSMGFEV